MSHRPLRVAIVIAAIVLVAALAPPPSRAAVTGCEDGSRQQRLTGSYVAAGEPYARAFVFAMQIDCKGKKEVVTVQRATGNLPVCEPGQQVELTGTLVWNRYLVDGHYEVNDPSGVTCRTVAATAPAVPSPPPAAAATAPPAVAATPPAAPPAAAPAPPAVAALPPPRPTAPAVWQGRYQDNRGEGPATFLLVRGASTVSGTWKLRTGGGGPVTGLIESDGRRIQLRMENLAPECPARLEGTGEISDSTLSATYRGQDCEGAITDGRLELHLQAATR